MHGVIKDKNPHFNFFIVFNLRGQFKKGTLGHKIIILKGFIHPQIPGISPHQPPPGTTTIYMVSHFVLSWINKVDSTISWKSQPCIWCQQNAPERFWPWSTFFSQCRGSSQPLLSVEMLCSSQMYSFGWCIAHLGVLSTTYREVPLQYVQGSSPIYLGAGWDLGKSLYF